MPACPSCEKGLVICHACDGKGYHIHLLHRSTCNTCDGKGRMKCPNCNGTARI